MAEFRRFASLFLVTFGFVWALAYAEELACEQEAPLIVLEWPSIVLKQNPQGVGQWQLPLSSIRPDVLTEARVGLKLVQDLPTENWKAQLHFTFPDPQPFGIPFTFQKAELSWATPEGTLTHRLDWSNSCSNAGRGLFPRHEFVSELELSGTRLSNQVIHPVLRIWGSRN